MKGKCLLLSSVFILIFTGCVDSSEMSENEPDVVDSVVSFIEDDPLIELEPEEFRKEYSKLPEDYRIKINKKELFESLLYYEPIKFSEDGTITKKQADKIERFKKDEDEKQWDSFSLKGLRYFRNLKHIDLQRCNLSDINELRYFNKLTELTFANCELTNIDFLKACSDLRIDSIRLPSNKITDISPLTEMKELHYLDLGKNKITDITSLSNLNGLEALSLDRNQIKDISTLPDLKKCHYLELSDNQIEDITVLSNLKEIQTLKLKNNQISDITPLSNLKEVLYMTLGNNPITDISPLKNIRYDEYDFEEEGAYMDLSNLNIDYTLAEEMFGKYLRVKTKK